MKRLILVAFLAAGCNVAPELPACPTRSDATMTVESCDYAPGLAWCRFIANGNGVGHASECLAPTGEECVNVCP